MATAKLHTANHIARAGAECDCATRAKRAQKTGVPGDATSEVRTEKIQRGLDGCSHDVEYNMVRFGLGIGISQGAVCAHETRRERCEVAESLHPADTARKSMHALPPAPTLRLWARTCKRPKERAPNSITPKHVPARSRVSGCMESIEAEAAHQPSSWIPVPGPDTAVERRERRSIAGRAPR